MKILKIIGKIFAVLFSTVYFFILTGFVILFFGSNLLSTVYYKDVLKSIDLKEIKVKDLNINTDELVIDENTSVQDIIVEGLEESGLNNEMSVAIVENEEIRGILGTYIGEYVNYQVSGGEIPEIKLEDVKTVLTNELIIEAVGETPTDEDIEKVYEELNNLTRDYIDGGGDKNEHSDTINPIY